MTANIVPLPTAGQRYTRDQIELVKRTLMPKGASDDELALFIGTAQRMGLDPFAQQIRAIRRKEYNADTQRYDEKISIEPGIDGFRLVAHRTGEVEAQLGPHWCGPDGKWLDAWLSEDPPAAARFGVWRKGYREPRWAVAHWREYRQTKRDGGVTRMWSDRPAGQLAKCAEALAWRATFPHELGGVYTTDEMAQADHDNPEAVISRFAVVEGGIPSEETIRALESVAAAKELVTREIVSDRYRQAVKSCEVDIFGEVWEDFWRVADLQSWREVLQAARETVQPQAIDPPDQMDGPAAPSPQGATGPSPTSEAGKRPGWLASPQVRDDPASDSTSPAPNPPSTAAAGAGGPTSPPSPAPLGDGGDTNRSGRKRRDTGTGKPGPSAAPAGPPTDEAEQAAFDQRLAEGDDPGRFTR